MERYRGYIKLCHYNLQLFTTQKIINFVTIAGLFIKHFEGYIENDGICSLSNDIPNIIVHCREKNTIKKKNSSFKLWEPYAKQHNFTTLPTKNFTVALFFINCIQKDYSFLKTEGIDFATKFCHKLGPLDPCSPFVVSSILVVAKKSSVRKTGKRKPITI